LEGRLDGRTWGARYAGELFRKIVAEVDPTHPYSDNSPYSPGAGAERIHPNDPNHGTHHQWEVWNRTDYSAYRGEIPRFCSEFGFQALPTWRTLIDWVHAADGGLLDAANDPKNDGNFLLHQKAADGNGKLDRGLAPHIGVPDSFADWHWATQLNQARAVTYAIDHYADGGRGRRARSSGSSTTAGRSLPGRRSTPRNGPSRSGMHCDRRSRHAMWSLPMRKA
jgi:beta-mannosidase